MAHHTERLSERRYYIPALGFRWLTPFYDLLQRTFTPELALKGLLVEQLGIRPGHRVLDVGAGTGTLTIMMARAHPDAHIVALDGDPQVLGHARAKANVAGVHIQWDEGLATELPYPAGSFDRVVTSLMLHHLRREDKLRALREMRRVLRPGGEVHIYDLGKPRSFAGQLIGLVFRHMEEAADNIDGLLPALMAQAGFAEVAERAQSLTIYGAGSYYSGVSPATRGLAAADAANTCCEAGHSGQ